MADTQVGVLTPQTRGASTGGSAVQKRTRRLAGTGAKRIALLAFTLVVWEALAYAVDNRSVPHAGPVADAAQRAVRTEQFWTALGGTAQSWALGMLIATLIGIPVGLVVGSNKTAMTATRGVIQFMRTVPAIMLVPLVVLVMGATVEMKVFLIALSAVWPLMIHASYGIGHVDRVARDSARVFGLGWRQRVVFLFLPSAMPVIATGLRVAATVALLISIGSEIVTSAPGIGHEILLAQANRASDRAFVYVLLSGVLGVVLNFAFASLERRAMFWHASQRARRTA